jgi:phosphoenolpyruvate---glycerone phosphotransferase subunit DhaL
MDAIHTSDLPALFDDLRRTFAEQRDFLIALDGKVGDSDLGITMSKAFAAAHEAVAAAEAGTPAARQFKAAGMAMAKAAPSTMGTLTATGFLRGSQTLENVETIGVPELAAFWRAYFNGVAERGKAKVGDKTLLDVLDPIATSLEGAAQEGGTLRDALAAASRAAEAALERTKSMVAQHGKAAAFQEKSMGLQDAGATVGVLIIQTMRDFVSGQAAA